MPSSPKALKPARAADDNLRMVSEPDFAAECAEIGARVRDARLAAGLRPRALARQSGVSTRALVEIESGRRVPTDDECISLAAACGVDVALLSPPARRLALAVHTDPGRPLQEIHGEAAREALLREYISMVVELRSTPALQPSSLRSEDLYELAQALGGTPEAIEARITDLLGSSPGEAFEARSAILPSTAASAEPAATAAFAAPPPPADTTAPRTPVRDEQRRVSRKPVTWIGRFGVGDEPEWEWRDCTIVDVSNGGARLLVRPEEVLRAGDTVVLVVERMGSTPVSTYLHGHVRRCTPRPDALEVGLELAFSTLQQQQIAESLFHG